MIPELRQDIFTIVNPISGLTGGLYYVRATQGNIKPYATFFIYAANTTRDTENRYHEYYMQFSVFDDSDTADVAETISQSIIDALDGAEGSISLTGYTVISIDNVVPIRTLKENHKAWHSFTQFRIKLYKN